MSNSIDSATMELALKALISEIIKRITSSSEAGGGSVYRFIREKRSTEGFFHRKIQAHKQYTRQNGEFCKKNELYIISFSKRGTNYKVLVTVKDDECLPNFNRSTFQNVLKSLDFK